MQNTSIGNTPRAGQRVALCAALLLGSWAAVAQARKPAAAPLTPQARRALVEKVGLKNAALRPRFVAKHRPGYRVTVPLARHADRIRDQKSSSRCWLFATTTLLSNKVAARGKKPPVLSVSYLNHHSMRRQAFGLLDQAVRDEKPDLDKVGDFGEGGQLPFAMDLVRKHGLIPESAMKSHFDADNSGVLRGQIERLLASATVEIGAIDPKHGPRRQAVADTYRKRVVELLDLALGKPPQQFVVDGKRYDPQSYRKALGIVDKDLRYVALVNQPHRDKATFTDPTGAFAKFNGTLVKPRTLRKVAQRAIDAGEALYFSANVGRDNLHRADDKGVPEGKRGILSVGAFDYRGILPVQPLALRDRMAADIDRSNHAMVLTGYDTRGRSNKVRKWQVDNSWGTTIGDGGRFHMYNDFMGMYLEKLFVPEHLVPAELRPHAAK